MFAQSRAYGEAFDVECELTNQETSTNLYSIAEIAERMNLNLKSDIYPLAEHLLYSQRVKVIDVVGPRLRGIYLPDTTSERS